MTIAITQAAEKAKAANSYEETRKIMVSFDKIKIQEYSPILGVNPATSHAPPVTIDWKYSQAATNLLDDYEETRSPRRDKSQMMLPGWVDTRKHNTRTN
jgi:hypothetical protein